MAQIRRLADEAIVTYDLGMDMEYKRRWADRSDDTFAVVVRR
jgi:CelD/BcsL family acetyltransferase involved in cellulose biosynthesis